MTKENKDMVDGFYSRYHISRTPNGKRIITAHSENMKWNDISDKDYVLKAFVLPKSQSIPIDKLDLIANSMFKELSREWSGKKEGKRILRSYLQDLQALIKDARGEG